MLGSLSQLATTLGVISAITLALFALLTTPRRATVARLREEVEVLRSYVETLIAENRQLRRTSRARRRVETER